MQSVTATNGTRADFPAGGPVVPASEDAASGIAAFGSGATTAERLAGPPGTDGALTAQLGSGATTAERLANLSGADGALTAQLGSGATTAERLANPSGADGVVVAQIGPFAGAGAQPVSGQTVADAVRDGVPEGKLDGWYIGHNGDGVARVYDPAVNALDSFSPFAPTGGVSASGTTTVYVNGANTGLEKAVEGARTLADNSGDKVYHLFNQANTGDTARPNRGSPALEALANTIYYKARSGETLRVSSTSEGSQVARYALAKAEGRLRQELGFERFAVRPAGREANRAAIAKTEEILSRVEVVTYGAHEGAFPVDGPKYLHIVNTRDPFALIKPGSSRAGDGAVIAEFEYNSGLDAHEFLRSYMPVLRDAGGLDFDRLYGENTRPGEVTVTDFR